ncbi:DNA repair protein XRCC1 [Pseudomyrmex gracilis]|uniref:DNA repair protein XRCC1 n=1 Tax=Pseudomyrmex gracilis TaxID=219809 RepID=UPI000994F5C5|nr:DNA repair protein XRCC1 [Pseudomyrmex gracilis]
MILNVEKIISCSSEHPSYPASNLLERNSEKWKKTWRCAKPGEMLAHVIFQLAEPSYITGIDVGNYQSCVVIVSGSTSADPDNWLVLINHQFMSNDEASSNKFRDQVQLFTKRELNPDTLKTKFDRVKVTCMQSANLKVLFGLSYIILRSDPTIDLGLDVFGRFKLKQPHAVKTPIEMMREKLLNKEETDVKTNYKEELNEQIKKISKNNFAKCQEEEEGKSKKRPLLEKLEAGEADEVFKKMKKDQPESAKFKNKSPAKGSKNKTVAKSPQSKNKTVSREETVANTSDIGDNDDEKTVAPSTSKKQSSPSNSENSSDKKLDEKKRRDCSRCCENSQDEICEVCQRLLPPENDNPKKIPKKKNVPQKPKKPFRKLFDDVTFSLSGYVNPQRDEIRRKAIAMGARYIFDPNTSNKKCSHLICAFKNTPKYQQLKNHTKIVSHNFIEECFDKKTRFPWRRYALDQRDRSQPESEEEIDGNQPESVYDMKTDPESD